jgi:hypothetical protein
VARPVPTEGAVQRAQLALREEASRRKVKAMLRPGWAYGGVLQRFAGLPVGVVPGRRHEPGT